MQGTKNLDDYSVVTDKTRYKIPVEHPHCVVELEVWSTHDVQLWLRTLDTAHPRSSGKYITFRSRLAGLRALEITAPKSAVLSYSAKVAPIRGKEVLDLTPVEIAGPDPVVLAEQRRIKAAVEAQLRALGIDPEEMVQEELSDEEAFDADDEIAEFGDGFIDPDELHESDAAMSGELHDNERDRSRSSGESDPEQSEEAIETDEKPTAEKEETA